MLDHLWVLDSHLESQFFAPLNAADWSALATIVARARQSPPTQWVAWQLQGQTLGYLHPERAQWVAANLADSHWQEHEQKQALVWMPVADAGLPANAAQRNTLLTQLLHKARHAGLLTHWRNECFSFWAADRAHGVDACMEPRVEVPPTLEFERSGFRFLGMVSHAAHINGFTADGRIWCGRRAQSKATDPGLWDNIAAGGVAAGESVLSCAVRELMEEAGLEVANPQALHDAGRVRITEAITQNITQPGGGDWHDEILHTFNLYLQPGQVPVNHDGEVEQFQCFTAPQWMDAVRAGQCTTDSVLTLLQARYAQGRIGAP